MNTYTHKQGDTLCNDGRISILNSHRREYEKLDFIQKSNTMIKNIPFSIPVIV